MLAVCFGGGFTRLKSITARRGFSILSAMASSFAMLMAPAEAGGDNRLAGGSSHRKAPRSDADAMLPPDNRAAIPSCVYSMHEAEPQRLFRVEYRVPPEKHGDLLAARTRPVSDQANDALAAPIEAIGLLT